MSKFEDMAEKDTLYARMLSGELSEKEITELKTSGEWDEIERIAKFAEELALPGYNKEKGIKKVKKAVQKQRGRTRMLHPVWRISAAASILILVASIFFMQLNRVTVSAEFASSKSFQFEDKSTVMLNDGSEITYNKNRYNKKQREIKLTGEAFFQVEKGLPFIVETDKGNVQVLGTSFNVRSWGNKLSVQCYTGKVRISSAEKEVVIAKGEAVIFENGAGGGILKKMDEIPSWINAVSKFKNENVNAVLEEMERQFNVEIVSPGFNQSFTGTFTHESLELALEQVCTPMGIRFKIDSEQKSVTILK